MSSDNKTNDIIGWLKFAGMSWLGPTLKASLIRKFKTPQGAFNATKSELAQIKGFDYGRIERFIAQAPLIKPVCEPQILTSKNISLISYFDSRYPLYLREIDDPPVVLFAAGNYNYPTSPVISIVGARHATQLGYDLAQHFAFELAKAGFVVASGLALGIDAHAHAGALKAGKQTIAVLANGLDVVYPKKNKVLREEIIKNGLLISEHPPGELARPWYFPVRNRIISGISVATIVVEASSRSGSLITARLAAEQNRDIFAIPGPIDSKFSEGTLELIKDGAILVTNPQDVIDYYKTILPAQTAKSETKKQNIDLTNEESKLLKQLSGPPLSIDNLIEDRKWKRNRLFFLLLSLEMREYLIKLPGNYYQAKI